MRPCCRSTRTVCSMSSSRTQPKCRKSRPDSACSSGSTRRYWASCSPSLMFARPRDTVIMTMAAITSRMPRSLRRASIAALLLVLGYALSVAARTGLADVYAEEAKTYLQMKREADEVLSRDEWQALYGSLTRALALAPGDPDNLSELGRLHRILLEADDLDAGQISRYGDAGAGYYRAALALRPTWPWDWGNLALVKYQQYQDTSGVYQDALVRAVEFGPREPSLQDRVAELGAGSWWALNAAAARAVLTAADRALERDAQSFSGRSDAKERWRPLCTRAGDSFAHIKRHCATLGLT